MSKKSNKPTRRKKNREAFASSQTNESFQNPNAGVVHDSRRWFLIAIFVVIALGGTYMAQAFRNANVDVDRYTYKVIKTYPHDPSAFTQGLALEDGIVYESTGKYDGQSSIRKVDLETGEILKKVTLPDDQFGEGLELVGDKIYQLTWKKGICYVYDRDLNELEKYEYDGQGWGLTYDGTHLIMSDGTSRLYFLDPENFKEVRTVNVRNGMAYVSELNELEYTNGKVYANRWRHDNIYEIDPDNGKVTGIIELSNIWKRSERPSEGVLNGIAVDANAKKLIVTGKYCPKIFEIELIKK